MTFEPSIELASALVAFGGLCATGAIARTATNIRSGGRTPVAGMLHAVFLLACMLSLGPLMSYVPLATLAAVLAIVAWNMSERERFRHLLGGPIGVEGLTMTAGRPRCLTMSSTRRSASAMSSCSSVARSASSGMAPAARHASALLALRTLSERTVDYHHAH